MTKTAIPNSPSREDYLDQGDRDLSWLGAKDPIVLFEDWLSQAGKTEPNDPNAMSLATVDGTGQADVRIVLLKGLDANGFVFYSNAESAKGHQLGAGAKAALCFHWKSLKRQVRIRGDVEAVSDAESDAYFSSRARGSRIGAWASQQSRSVASKEALVDAVKAVEAQYEGKDVPRPPHWIGWRVRPNAIEFWQDGAFRLHDRILFTTLEESDWTRTRLFP